MAVQRLGSLLLLVLFLAHRIDGQGLDCSASKGFKQGAEQFVQVQYREIYRSGFAKKVFTQAEVFWQPSQMLDASACYDLAAAELMMKPQGRSEWQRVDGRQRDAGKYAKWTVEVKPCLKYEFKVQVSGNSLTGGEYHFQLQQTVGPASIEDILASRYKPEPPTNFRSHVGANSANLSWDSSDCADAYEVSYNEVGTEARNALMAPTSKGENRVRIDSLKPCTRYEASIIAILGNEYSDSDLVAGFATKPRLDGASDLQPELKPSLESVFVTWKAWQSVSCIDEYRIKICERPSGKCLETQTVNKPQGLPTVAFTSAGLESCVDYTMEIQPVFPDTEIESKFVDFRTLSPRADTLSVESVSARSVSSGSMRVEWSEVRCASNYKVYQKETQASKWSEVANTPPDESEITVDNITPCTKYHFAISAVLADGSETSMAVGPELISDLDEKDPFMAPNLYVMNADRHADITWGHADCIDSYLVKVCQKAYTDCLEEAVDPSRTGGDKSIHYRIENLDPCTQYSLEIVPVIAGKSEFKAKPTGFTTTNGTPQAPGDFKIVLLPDSSTELTWSRAQCATGYKIYQKVGDGPVDQEPVVAEVTSQLEQRFREPMPCETYFYSIATLVDEQESARTEWYSISIPPKTGLLPELKILNRENDNITLRLKVASANDHCAIAEYDLAFSSDGGETFGRRKIGAEEAGEHGDLVLAFPGAMNEGTIINARVKYAGTDLWSEEATTGQRNAPRKSSFGGSGIDKTALIPIIVGVAILAVIAVVITIVMLRRKKRRAGGFDAGKAAENGNNKKSSHHHTVVTDEETQKLNEHPEV